MLFFGGYIIISMEFKNIDGCWFKHIDLLNNFFNKCEIVSQEILTPIQKQIKYPIS